MSRCPTTSMPTSITRTSCNCRPLHNRLLDPRHLPAVISDQGWRAESPSWAPNWPSTWLGSPTWSIRRPPAEKRDWRQDRLVDSLVNRERAVWAVAISHVVDDDRGDTLLRQRRQQPRSSTRPPCCFRRHDRRLPPASRPRARGRLARPGRSRCCSSEACRSRPARPGSRYEWRRGGMYSPGWTS